MGAIRFGVMTVALLSVGVAACADDRPEAADQPSTTTSAAEVTPSQAQPAIAPRGETVDVMISTPDGRERTAHLYIPASLPTEPVPLLVALHGGTGSGSQFEGTSGYDELAEANGFLVVYPDGVGSGGDEDRFRTWNGGVCCGAAAPRRMWTTSRSSSSWSSS